MVVQGFLSKGITKWQDKIFLKSLLYESCFLQYEMMCFDRRTGKMQFHIGTSLKCFMASEGREMVQISSLYFSVHIFFLRSTRMR